MAIHSSFRPIAAMRLRVESGSLENSSSSGRFMYRGGQGGCKNEVRLQDLFVV
jgi:hypothetical protein